VRCGQGLHLSYQALPTVQPKVRLDTPFQRLKAQLFQAGYLSTAQHLGWNICEWRAPPQRQCFGQRARCFIPVAGAPRRGADTAQVGESQHVQLIATNLDQVSSPVRDDP
jgi:hypothetical protein